MIKQLLTITILMNSILAFSQTYEGNVRLETQAEVNEFGTNNYSIINGDLAIHGGNSLESDPIVDLSPLNSLEEVNDIRIVELYGITDTLKGFENLHTLYGNLEFDIDEDESRMIVLDAFNSLEDIGGILSIRVQSNLKEIKGFNLLETVGEHLFIKECNDLEKIFDFNTLDVVGKSLAIETNSNLNTIDAFSALSAIGDNMQISENPELLSISGFNELAGVGLSGEISSLNIQYNSKLKSVKGFNNVQMLPNLNITDNELLEELDAFNGWEDATFDGSENMTHTIFNIIIGQNSNLSTINAFTNMTKCHNMVISEIPNIDNLDFLCKLEEIVDVDGNMGFVTVNASPTLNDCYALCTIPAATLNNYQVSINGGSGDCSDAFSFINACGDHEEACTVSNQDIDTELFAIYPNPTADKIHIEGASDDITVEIRSLDGKQMDTFQYNGSTEIDIAHYNRGAYLIHIMDNKSQTRNSYRIMKL